MGAALSHFRVALDLGEDPAFQEDAFEATAFDSDGYVDVSDDLIQAAGATIDYGIAGNGPRHRMAGPGSLAFTLNNAANNSGGLQGYYSPNHANCRSGFTYEIGVRAYLSDGTQRRKFTGKLYDINPVTGQYRSQRVRCVARDLMYELGETDVRSIPPQVSAMEDTLLQAVLDALPASAQPAAADVDLDTGLDTYAYAFYDLSGGVKATTALAKVNTSAWGKIFVKGDGTFRYLNRQAEVLQTSEYHFTDTLMRALVTPSTLDNVFNAIRTTIRPKTLGATATEVLYAANTTIQVAAGESLPIWVDYSDPNDRNVEIGGTDMVTLVSGTDWKANSAANGSGSDITADVTVVGSLFASTAKLVITNNNAGTAYLVDASGDPLLQVRGRGIYDHAPTTLESVSGNGNRPLSIDLVYQNDENVAQSLADYIRAQYESLAKQVNSITINPQHSTDLMTQALDREPGDIITISEAVSGLHEVEVIIHHVHLAIKPGPWLECTWTVAPKLVGDQWLLDDAVLSVLGTTTILSHV